MSVRYPIDALLRPPVELWSALVAFLAALVALLAPWTLLMTPGVAWACSAVLLWLAALRLEQGLRIVRYHRNLRRLPSYILPARHIPLSQRKLFLGKGFQWTQQHTQRLRDTIRPEVQHYIQSSKVSQWARRKEIEWESLPVLSLVAGLLSWRRVWNPLAPLPPVGGKPQLHAVEPDEHDVWMDLGERVGHTLVLGTTRVGKTRFAEILISQDIRRGDVVIVFDPKGDAALLQRVYAEAKRARREDQFYLFHLGYPELSARYNAVGSFERITEVATRIANQLPGDGNSAAFKEFGWRFVNIIARALVALGRRPDYQQIARHITNIEPLFLDYCKYWFNKTGIDDWQQTLEEQEESKKPLSLKGRSRNAMILAYYLREHDLYEPVLDGLRTAIEYDRTYFDKIVASVLPLLEKLTTGKTAELIAPNYFAVDDPRPIFDWRQVIRTGGIVYVGLDALSDTTVAGSVGNSMFADLVSVAGELYKYGVSRGLPVDSQSLSAPMISVHADEFNEIIGEEFIPLLNKSGGAGFQVCAYTQTWSDIEARVGNRAKAGQITGNFNTLIMLRVKELLTAELLTRQLPQVEIFSLMQVSASDDSSNPESAVDFTSRNEDRISVSEVPLLTPADIVTLPKGQAFALLEGGQLWKLRMPLAAAENDPEIPDDIQQIAAEMAQQYMTSDHWWQEQPLLRASGLAADPSFSSASPHVGNGLPEREAVSHG